MAQRLHMVPLQELQKLPQQRLEWQLGDPRQGTVRPALVEICGGNLYSQKGFSKLKPNIIRYLRARTNHASFLVFVDLSFQNIIIIFDQLAFYK